MAQCFQILTLLTVSLYVAGCAGPTTPFGAISLKHLLHDSESDDTTTDGTGTGTDGDDDDTEVAKKSSTAKKLVAEVPTAPAQVVVIGNSPAAPTTTTKESPSSNRSVSLPVQTVASGTTSPTTTVSGSGGTVTMSGPVVNREAGRRAPASIQTQASASNIQYAKPRISFTPKRQILHAGVTFAVTVDDPMGIPRDYEIMLLYNNIDMTSKFMLQAEETLSGRPPTKLTLTFDHLHLLPDRDNKIELIYWHSHNDRPTYASFYPPHCSAFKPLTIATTGDFEVSTKMVDSISGTAKGNHLNPTYLAGLIAQESAFNEKAVSSAKALGLTQITGSGEAQVIRDSDGWPRYPNINHISSPLLKVKVMAGKINGQNEWRLNPDLSIQGGAKYLSYLNDYWRKPANISLVSNNFHDVDLAISQLILASYNSGPSRVNEALQSHGRRWLRDDEELNEARKYVKRVMSYCDYFSRQEEDSDATAP